MELPIVESAITIIICVVGVNRSMNALNAPVRSSKDRNSEFNFLISEYQVRKDGTRN